ncbi:hypothetical protein IKW73_03025 [Candidatus Saccharibacteria bacterium]|nr:hypothetical protein [Candidatus Saccharibacteria bacterium]
MKTQYDECKDRYESAEQEKTPCPPKRHANKREHAEIAGGIDENGNKIGLKWVYIEPV